MSILVYSRTAGYRHDSIPTALSVIETFGYNTTLSEDPTIFSSPAGANLSSVYQTIVFLHNSDEILDTADQKTNLEKYLLNGGGLVGIHSATAALFSTPYYGAALGAFFDYHPELQDATFVKVNGTSNGTEAGPSIEMIPERWTFEEEVYNFRSDPRAANISLLLAVDPDSYQDDNKADAIAKQGGLPHPISWYREGGLVDLGNGTDTNGMNATNGSTVEEGTFVMPGRMWYTALGHTNETWQNATFQAHVKAGIDWVLAGPVNGTNSTITSTASGETGSVPAATGTGVSRGLRNASLTALLVSLLAGLALVL